MIEKPARRHNLAAHDERHRRIERLERQRQSHIFACALKLGIGAHLPAEFDREAGIFHPGQKFATTQQTRGFVPITGLRRSKSKARRARIARIAERDHPPPGGRLWTRFNFRHRRHVAVKPATHFVPSPALAAIDR
ncbi:hypothetical protein [Sphingopyxis sp. GW247-27LB]|uniref:hypothetical protein n=1 Tax=Sphingopyxis sp. GW247-27LB TaxID=2012632 RepID=UPI0020D09AE0|nr:hypothetical protein [Sphingopyxis sp. GW247-27LB]